MSHGTASNVVVPGWFVEFQLALLRAAPRDIPQDIADGWRGNGEGLAKVLRENLLPPVKVEEIKPEIVLAECEWPVWKWVDLGLPKFQTADHFRAAFKAHKPQLHIGDYADSMMGHEDFVVAQSPLKLPLAKVTVANLGFTQWTRYDAICARADKLGLDLCPSEVGPQLRRQYLDQPLGEWIAVAMKAIPASGLDLYVFDVERNDDGLWLDGFNCRPDDEFYPESQLVFVPRKYQKPLAA